MTIWNEYFSYSPGTGDLMWKVRPKEHFNTDVGCDLFNKAYAGKTAGSQRHGHVRVTINGKNYAVAQIVWEIHRGPLPPKVKIASINGIENDTRIENLQLVTGKRDDTTTRVKGVSWSKRTKKWKARIRSHPQGKKVVLGYFPTKALAAEAYAQVAYDLDPSRKVSVDNTF